MNCYRDKQEEHELHTTRETKNETFSFALNWDLALPSYNRPEHKFKGV